MPVRVRAGGGCQGSIADQLGRETPSCQVEGRAPRAPREWHPRNSTRLRMDRGFATLAPVTRTKGRVRAAAGTARQHGRKSMKSLLRMAATGLAALALAGAAQAGDPVKIALVHGMSGSEA